MYLEKEALQPSQKDHDLYYLFKELNFKGTMF